MNSRLRSTLFDKIWADHVITQREDGTWLLYMDRVFLHERTGSIALSSLRSAGRRTKNPRHVFGTMDHIVDTFPGRTDKTLMPNGTEFIRVTRELAAEDGIALFDLGDERQGISHVVSAEQGIALPGCTVICPDSHTCSLGALGALAIGVGSSECEHALATETLRFFRPRQMRVRFDGRLGAGVTAKDMILHLISSIGAAGAAGYAVEFAGQVISELSIEARLTLCNMAVELSAFTGIIAPDEVVFDYLKGRPYAPSGAAWNEALAYWSGLRSDTNAVFDREIAVDCAEIAPTVTWGTSPQHAMPINGCVPDPSTKPDEAIRKAMERALEYMDLRPGTRLEGIPIQAAFIGSCTNSRLSDLRAAARILSGRRAAPGVKAICVPGSSQVKRQAEREGLDQVFRAAGFEWRESGCSLCFYAGGEGFALGTRVISSTNRNFEGRQGPGTRTHLASPATVAASAIAGHIADLRDYLE